jgi:hypothetical protein
MNEDAIQQHVVHLMRAHGRPEVCYFAVANGEARSLATGAKLKRQGVIAGAPDLVFLVDGNFYGVELKTDKGKLSEAQSAFGDWIRGAGGTYRVVYGMDDAARYLKQIGAIRPNVTFSFPTAVADGRSGVRERPWKQSSGAASAAKVLPGK